MSGKHFLADRDELLGGFNTVFMHLRRKGVGGGGQGRTKGLDRPQEVGAELGQG